MNILSHQRRINNLTAAIASTPWYAIPTRIKLRRERAILQHIEANPTAFLAQF